MSPALTAAGVSAQATALALHFLEKRPVDGASSASLQWQMEHRVQLVRRWQIPPGARVLEIGCGQGDCTIALADAVGSQGHVDAIDPGAPDYGAPFTLSQAQGFIRASPIGDRITFFHSTVGEYLANYQGPAYDFVVMCHCVYYFETPAILGEMVDAVATAAPTQAAVLCMAEWSLHASRPNAQPHVLVALILCVTEARRKTPSSGNIRTVLSPRQIGDVVQRGTARRIEATIEPANEGLLDPWWEVRDALRAREHAMAELQGDGVDAQSIAAIQAMYDSLQASVDLLPAGVDDVKAMDVWIATFKV